MLILCSNPVSKEVIFRLFEMFQLAFHLFCKFHFSFLNDIVLSYSCTYDFCFGVMSYMQEFLKGKGVPYCLRPTRKTKREHFQLYSREKIIKHPKQRYFMLGPLVGTGSTFKSRDISTLKIQLINMVYFGMRLN